MEWVTTTTMLQDLRASERGDRWDGFMERFRGPIVGFARKLGLSADDAEDVAQETLVAFARAYREGKYDRQRGRLSQWLFGIAYRQAMKERERGRRRDVVIGADPLEFLQSVPDRQRLTRFWDEQWEQALLAECLTCARREVEPSTFLAFEMTALGDRPAAEVAEALGVSVTAVYNAKHRVVKRLRELREMFEDS